MALSLIKTQKCSINSYFDPKSEIFNAFYLSFKIINLAQLFIDVFFDNKLNHFFTQLNEELTSSPWISNGVWSLFTRTLFQSSI